MQLGWHEIVAGPKHFQEGKHMTDKPRIAMTPGELPDQRIHEVVNLPPEPEGFEPVGCYGWEPEEIMPKNRPRDMLYLGSLEWAWGPMHGRIEAYFLHRGRTYWLLYTQDLDPNEPEFAWMVAAFGNRKDVDERQAAVHLVVAKWREEVIQGGLDHFHWINQDGYLSVPEWMAIAREVWGSSK